MNLLLSPADETKDLTIAWHPAARVLFRFAFAFLILYIYPFPFYYLPFVGGYFGRVRDLLFDWLIPFLAKICFGLDALPKPPYPGSGDTTRRWIEIFSCLVVAVVTTAIWSAFDRKRKNYAVLNKWLRLYVRLSLASTLLGYGAAKVIPTQFPAPELWRLLETYGESSPMGLLWTFMGASKAYTIFTGAAEFVAGVILLFSRFTTLGALISVAVFVNVFMLNMSYDVPVKAASFLFLAMSLFLLIPDVPALTQLLVLRKTVVPAQESPYFSNPLVNLLFLVLQILLGVYIGCTALSGSYETGLRYGEMAPKSVLYGIWFVDEFSINGEIIPPLLTDKKRWRQLIFLEPTLMIVLSMDGNRDWLKVRIDRDKHLLELSPSGDKGSKANFSLKEPDKEHIVLEGTKDGENIKASMHKEDDSKFLLKSRGFHWISETPFNR